MMTNIESSEYEKQLLLFHSVVNEYRNQGYTLGKAVDLFNQNSSERTLSRARYYDASCFLRLKELGVQAPIHRGSHLMAQLKTLARENQISVEDAVIIFNKDSQKKLTSIKGLLAENIELKVISDLLRNSATTSTKIIIDFPLPTQFGTELNFIYTIWVAFFIICTTPNLDKEADLVLYFESLSNESDEYSFFSQCCIDIIKTHNVTDSHVIIYAGLLKALENKCGVNAKPDTIISSVSRIMTSYEIIAKILVRVNNERWS